MIHKREELPIGAESRISDPSCGLVDHVPGRKFQVILTTGSRGVSTYDRQRLAIGRPVGAVTAFEYLPRCSAGQRNPCQDAKLGEPETRRMQQDRHLTLGRDGKDLRCRQPNRPRIGAVKMRREKLLRTSSL